MRAEAERILEVIRQRHVDEDDDSAIATALRDAVRGRL